MEAIDYFGWAPLTDRCVELEYVISQWNIMTGIIVNMVTRISLAVTDLPISRRRHQHCQQQSVVASILCNMKENKLMRFEHLIRREVMEAVRSS